MNYKQRFKEDDMMIPLLALILILCMDFGLSDQDIPPTTVTFKYLKGVYSRSRDDLKSMLSNHYDDKMRSEISKLQTPYINEVIFNTLKEGLPREDQILDKGIKSALNQEFRHDTLRFINKQTPNNSCGAIVDGAKIKFLHCPGNVIILTLDFTERLSCRAIEKMNLFGPIILKNEICHQKLVVSADCTIAYQMGYIKSGCSIVKITQVPMAETISLSIISLILMFLMSSLILFLYRFKTIKKNYNLSTKTNLIELTTFVTLDESRNDWTHSKADPERPNTRQLTHKVTITRLLICMFCFFPLKVDSYDLINSQSIAGEKFKYDILMGDNERIPIGTTYIGMSDHSAISRLSWEFDTFPWKLIAKNDYACLQSKCNDITICREDILPFQPANDKVKEFLNIEANRTVYSTCKNMWNYCTFASGCFIIGAILDYDIKNPYRVFKVGKQLTSVDNLNLPPGCYLDYIKIDESSDLEGLYYIENAMGESWFCKSNLYSHHPSPHSLGDLKVDHGRNVNFVSDHIRCATDRWRDVYCYLPESFIQEIDSYCVRNNEDNLGYKVIQKDSSLRWEGRSLMNIKITCDRNLNLIHSKDHCEETTVDVWDTQNEKDDLLLTIISHSDSNSGLFSFPKSVHMEVHTFPCNSQPYSTILYDLKSLNSSGIQFNYHINKKSLVPDEAKGESITPEGNHGGYEVSFPSLLSYITKIFSGFSTITIVIVVIVIIFMLKK